MTVYEAAKRSGIPASTIRRWYAEGRLRSRMRGHRPKRVEVALHEVLEVAELLERHTGNR